MAGKITKVFNAADQIQADVIHDHLKQNGIESMSKQPGTGEYMNIAMGYSVYGTDIYVREDQKAKAEALSMNYCMIVTTTHQLMKKLNCLGGRIKRSLQNVF